jgi:hypothetical protein
MRVFCRIAIAWFLGTSISVVASQQPPGYTTSSAAQAVAPSSVKEESAPPGAANPQTTSTEQGVAERSEMKKSSSPASGAKKHHKRSAPAQPSGAPRKIVVREGGATEPAAQIAPDITPAQAARERQNAEQFLNSADGNLKSLVGRSLNTQQEDTVGHIRNYMAGARTALKEGDVERASTLAQKAHLLAEDLAKH